MKTKITYLICAMFSAACIISGCQSTVKFASERDSATRSNRNTPAPETQAGKTPKTGSASKDAPVLLADNSGFYKEDIISEAEKWLGVPYKWGGRDTSGTDCSGFVQSVYKAFGFSIPRTASDQFDFSEMVTEEDAIPGDLVFFKINDRIVHVGLYTGNNTMIHASTKSGVILQDLSKYFYYSKKENIAGFGRIVRN